MLIDEYLRFVIQIEIYNFNTIRPSTWSPNVMNEAFTTHFQSQTITATVEDIPTEIFISELIKKNHVLISLASNNNNPPVKLVAGKNCCLSDDNSEIAAGVTGYPVLTQTKTGRETIVSVAITPIIDIAADKMLATLTLYPCLPNAQHLELNDILALCKEQEINCGLDELTIQESIEQVMQLQQPLQDVPIARGLLPVDGKDAYLRFEVEIGPLPGKILQDGSIDWRERKIFIGIDKDELIATKIPLTPGTPGTDIHCLPILQKPGKDIKVKVTGDVQYIEETGQVLATCSGVLSIVNETDVKVSAKQTIDGDVDFSVGNIESNDGLEIKGDVKPGFTISCKGDLLIGGNIHNATLRVKGNSKIASGLIGEPSELIADGDVEISFIERAMITSGGTVVVAKGAYYAKISSRNKILCKPDSKVIGGTFCSSLDFIGGIIGSDNATPAIIAAGVEPERFQQRTKLRASISELEHELKNLIQVNGHDFAETTIYKKKESTLEKRRNNLKRLNIIPNSPLYSRQDPTFNHCLAKVIVQDRIVSGTKIRIGNTSTTVTEDAAAICFYIDRQTGHIVACPYTKG
ncbi:MAG: hypothetical protein ACI8ZB_002834 [Desulforhopalus sp.]|jgi:uncharacterized protein (DUF342 family)